MSAGKCLIEARFKPDPGRIQAGSRKPAAIVRKPRGRPGSVRKIVFSATLQRSLIGRPLVNPLDESRYVGKLLRARTLGSGFEREAHLHVGGAEGVAREPFGLRQLALDEAEVQFQLRVDETVLHGLRDPA